MARIHIRDLDDEVVERLKERARCNHRSLQGEVKAILEEAAKPRMSTEEMLAMIDRWQAHWQARGKVFSDSADLIREDRDSR